MASTKAREHMVFHGFVDHAWDYFIIELSFIKKGNSTTLAKHKTS